MVKISSIISLYAILFAKIKKHAYIRLTLTMAYNNKRDKCEDTNLTPLILCGVPKVHILNNILKVLCMND